MRIQYVIVIIIEQVEKREKKSKIKPKPIKNSEAIALVKLYFI